MTGYSSGSSYLEVGARGRYDGPQGARQVGVVQMANPIRSFQYAYAAAATQSCEEAAESSQSAATPRSEERPLLKGANAAFERWLQGQLRLAYQEVCSEPLPAEFMELIDGFGRHGPDRQRGEEPSTEGDRTERQRG